MTAWENWVVWWICYNKVLVEWKKACLLRNSGLNLWTNQSSRLLLLSWVIRSGKGTVRAIETINWLNGCPQTYSISFFSKLKSLALFFFIFTTFPKTVTNWFSTKLDHFYICSWGNWSRHWCFWWIRWCWQRDFSECLWFRDDGRTFHWTWATQLWSCSWGRGTWGWGRTFSWGYRRVWVGCSTATATPVFTSWRGLGVLQKQCCCHRGSWFLFVCSLGGQLVCKCPRFYSNLINLCFTQPEKVEIDGIMKAVENCLKVIARVLSRGWVQKEIHKFHLGAFYKELMSCLTSFDFHCSLPTNSFRFEVFPPVKMCIFIINISNAWRVCDFKPCLYKYTDISQFLLISTPSAHAIATDACGSSSPT